jgi:hypothetical protein
VFAIQVRTIGLSSFGIAEDMFVAKENMEEAKLTMTEFNGAGGAPGGAAGGDSRRANRKRKSTRKTTRRNRK